jgi:hypothetical protein
LSSLKKTRERKMEGATWSKNESDDVIIIVFTDVNSVFLRKKLPFQWQLWNNNCKIVLL